MKTAVCFINDTRMLTDNLSFPLFSSIVGRHLTNLHFTSILRGQFAQMYSFLAGLKNSILMFQTCILCEGGGGVWGRKVRIFNQNLGIQNQFQKYLVLSETKLLYKQLRTRVKLLQTKSKINFVIMKEHGILCLSYSHRHIQK